MNEFTVATLQELLDTLDSFNGEDLAGEFRYNVKVSDDITIDSSVNISTQDYVSIDLQQHTLTINADEGFKLISGDISFYNGTIIGASNYPFVATGANSELSFGSDLTVIGTYSIAKAQKKARINVSGADITSNGTDGYAFYVEGYTIAAKNTELVGTIGTITAQNQAVIGVAKRGIVQILSCTLDALNGNAVELVDDSATVVNFEGGKYRGTIPNGSVSDEYSIEEDADGFYIVHGSVVVAESSDSDVDVSSENDSVVGSDVDSDTDSEEYAPAPSEIEPIVDDSEDNENTVSTPFNADDFQYVGDPVSIEIPDDATFDVVPDETSIEEPVEESEVVPAQNIVDASEVVETKYAGISDVLYKPKTVYASPSFKFSLGQIIGAYMIYAEPVRDNVTKQMFYPIKYKLPGNGRIATAWIPGNFIKR